MAPYTKAIWTLYEGYMDPIRRLYGPYTKAIWTLFGAYKVINLTKIVFLLNAEMSDKMNK